ncbi:unnamed protein product, partial [Tetraodon nigroviridis]
CGNWVRNADGGSFSSPNYPNTYPPNKECLYVLEALPRQRIELLFDQSFYIEASFECRFDHIEVRDGPFSFSPLINRFCAPPVRGWSSPAGASCGSASTATTSWRESASRSGTASPQIVSLSCLGRTG